MRDILDLDRYPLNEPDSPDLNRLVSRCRDRLTEEGLFNLPGFVRHGALARAVAEVWPPLSELGFLHERVHNIYFKHDIEGLDPDHPALREFKTSNRTICADQIPGSAVIALYDWPPLARFLAAVMGKPALYTMADPLARANVMSYSEGQALNWHFDRSEFTTTLLLQAPDGGGAFEYVKNLRSDNDPNYDGVSELLEGQKVPTRMPLEPGTLNVFKGKNTAHRVTPVEGPKARIIAVFSYFEQPGVTFSDEERIGFYGRAA